MKRYYLKADYQECWDEVSKEAWIQAECNAGFHSKLSALDPDYMTTCATGGFSGHGVSGKIVYVDQHTGEVK